MAKKIKIGDLVRIVPQDGWETLDFDWDGDSFYRGGRYGVILESFHKPFNKPYSYDTWKIKLISGNIAIYPTRDLEVLASS
jgi:hypothetical protein